MKKSMLPAVAVAVAVSGAVLAATAAPASDGATSYWGCSPGYEFEVDSGGNGAHCRKPQSQELQPIVCPNVTLANGEQIATVAQVMPARDKCIGRATAGGITQTTEHDNLGCTAGYEYVQNAQGSADWCVRRIPERIVAPTRAFTGSP